MTISITDTEKGELEYCLCGQGKTILIIHGGQINCKETIFQKGLDPNKYCFLTPSRPGYGNTPLTESNKTPKGTAELYIALLDKLNLSKAIVIGVSAGGLTALEIAANYSGRVEKLFLMSALTKKMFNKSARIYRKAKIFFYPKMERFTWTIYRGLFKLTPKFMATVMFKALSKYRPVLFTKTEFQELKQMSTNMQSGKGFYNDLDQNINQEILRKILCLSLILHSETDNQVSIEHAVNAKENIMNAKMITFKNRWGHMLWFGDEYQAVLTELKSFLG